MTILLAIIRAVHFGACLLPLSVFTTMLLVVNPSVERIAGRAAGLPGVSSVAEHFHRQLRRVFLAKNSQRPVTYRQSAFTMNDRIRPGAIHRVISQQVSQVIRIHNIIDGYQFDAIQIQQPSGQQPAYTTHSIYCYPHTANIGRKK